MMSSNMINEICVISDNANMMLKNAMERLGLSGRAYLKILQVARTIADLEASDKILEEHIAEAIRFRSLDRINWGN